MRSQNQRRAIARTTMKVRSRTHFLPHWLKHVSVVPDKEGIEDRTETNLVNLRRVIYLTIMNALNYEEAVHKLLKVQLKEGEEEV
jgi:hypothetical protein